MNSVLLNELFVERTGEDTYEVANYSERLASVVNACPEPNVVLESQQWSKLAAIQCQDGGVEIFDADKFTGNELPFDPSTTSQWIAYFWNRTDECWDLAWVAVWQIED